VNLKGVWLCMRAELNHMADRPGSAIVNTSSVAGLRAFPGGGAYAASKHGVIGLTRSAAIEYARRGVRVNALCPGLTRSGMTQRVERNNPAVFASLLPPLGRAAEPEEMAGMVVFLCSAAASFLTGQAITIDGGASAL
jgi:NAD(P)-dependent dehydrogenase (short-subunit alcohol dehydrogenase family)